MNIKEAVVKVASSNLEKEDLLKQISKINSNGAVVQIFDLKSVINKMHILGAYLNATESFAEKTNISGSVAMEMLLFAAMTRQISDAIEKVGAKSGKKFIVFANNMESYQKIKKFIKEEEDFNPSQNQVLATAKKFGIEQKSDIDQFVLQKIAISRLEA